MPQIPIYNRQQQIPDTQVTTLKNVDRAGAVERGMNGLGQTIKKRGDEMHEQEVAIKAIDAFSAFSNEWNGYVREELSQKGQQTFGNVERAHAQFEDMKKRFSSSVDKEVYERIYPQLQNMQTGSFNTLGNHQLKHRNLVVDQKYKAAVETVNQMVINDSDLPSIENAIYGSETAPGLFDLVDQLNPGIDNTEQKAKLEREVLGNYLDQLAQVDPDSVPKAANALKGRLPEDTIQKALESGEMAEALRDLDDSPETFDGKLYENLAPDQQAKLDLKAKALVQTRLAKEVSERDKAEIRAERNFKKMQRINNTKVINAYTRRNPQTNERAISWKKIEKAHADQLIDDATYKYLYSDKKGSDNPYVTGALMKDVAMGRDISEALDYHLHNGDLTADTYLTLQKSIGDDNYKEGITALRGALEPGEFDKYNEDKNLKWAEGFARFNQLIEDGKSPQEAKNIVLGDYFKGVQRTHASLPVPKYLDSVEDSNDVVKLREAKARTVEAFRKGQLSPSDYRYEMQNIMMYMETANELAKQKINATTDDVWSVKQ